MTSKELDELVRLIEHLDAVNKGLAAMTEQTTSVLIYSDGPLVMSKLGPIGGCARRWLSA